MSFITSQIQVAIRVRPFGASEDPSNPIIYHTPDDYRKITIRKETQVYESYYDYIFTKDSTQQDIYSFIKPLFSDIRQGINSTIFTYGQTGSGKTYTMFGNDWTTPSHSHIFHKDKYNFIQNEFVIDPFSQDNGIIPRAINEIFAISKDHVINCSYVQIYNEKIYDLLDESLRNGEGLPKFSTYIKDVTTVNPIAQKSLVIRENKENGLYIEGVTEYYVETFYDCLNILRQGEKVRKKRQTTKNEMSSRSHTLFILSIISKKVDENGYLKKAKVHFCDLAGSEKYDTNTNYVKYHFNEMVNINKSLSTLGNVINALANKKSHIPYRDSKLTQLLQHSLGGNTKTFLIANISPSRNSFEETVSTLKFADRVHSLFTKVEPNQIEALDHDLVHKLTQELHELKQLLNIRRKKGTLGTIEEEVIQLREENEKLRKNIVSNDQIEKLIKENSTLKKEVQKLSHRNTTTDTRLPKDNSIFSTAGNDIMNNYSMYKQPQSKAIQKELMISSNRLKALDEMELQSKLKMSQEIESIKYKQNDKLFSKRKNKFIHISN